jgi:hypothetical protein
VVSNEDSDLELPGIGQSSGSSGASRSLEAGGGRHSFLVRD